MDRVQLLDAAGRTIGTAPKLEAHRAPGQFHRAVSVVLLDSAGRTLLQQRPATAYHFAGRWSNACCTHPQPDEEPSSAAARRLGEEMGVSVVLSEVGTIDYRAEDPSSGLVENERDHVFVGRFEGVPQPRGDLVSDWTWVDLRALRLRLIAAPARYTPWLGLVLDFTSPDPGV